MNLYDAMTELLAAVTGPAASYEGASGAVALTLDATDRDWVAAVQARLTRVGLELSASADAAVAAYGALATSTAGIAILDEDPLGPLTDPLLMPAWTGPTAYATVAARAAGEASALRLAGGSWAPALADLIESHALAEDLELAGYEREVAWAAVAELGSPPDAAEAAYPADAAITRAASLVNILPRRALGRRPLYTVTAEDTLETIARAVLGSADRVAELVAAYNLYPPYLAPSVRAGCLWPGARVLLGNDAESAGEEEAYGLSWGLEAIPAEGGQQWDLRLDDSGGLVVLAGLDALAAELGLRLTQPLGDWPEPDLQTYGVPLDHIGSPVTGARIGRDYAIAAALLEDPRVLTATPLFAEAPARMGLLVQDILVVPVPPAPALE